MVILSVGGVVNIIYAYRTVLRSKRARIWMIRSHNMIPKASSQLVITEVRMHYIYATMHSANLVGIRRAIVLRLAVDERYGHFYARMGHKTLRDLHLPPMGYRTLVVF
ncbi:hypothetical protein Moror_4340 [Moniliophthora roreri MCA 2997]|uniref:Uncharacterized protein n=1 Tax=Moniliophthora roreri (strain MCA 2997) TaxID=1381753 RepID=V2XFZ7_MONRO|nr:hypothetical protein Moror_4340 [Moniliophthora roreri MCA 2997]